ncbi:phage tail protein [Paenibacillus sp. LjRoot56]|uniref:phage tail protein n=1 Tax=Paenibacillus sp. LjRoot56 TaxID=3342333 RepID=UPI003ECCAB84
MAYVGEIRMFGGNFAPVGWMFCSGQILPISQYESLFSLLGTTYGGDGVSTFALPNLQSRVPLHVGDEATFGEQGGVEEVTLTVNQIPAHSHAFGVSSKFGSTNTPEGTVLARSTLNQFTDSVGTAQTTGILGSTGGSGAHSNIQPYLAINYIICVEGDYPSIEGGMYDEEYLAEIRWVAFNFVPRGWALCNGQTLPIAQNQALFALMGTTYGGNGQSTFALPNLQNRIPIHMGEGFTIGESGGEKIHTLTTNEMPAHMHSLRASLNTADSKNLANHTFGMTTTSSYGYIADNTSNSSMVAYIGGGQPHENRQPFLCLNAIIATEGIFPSRN